MPARSAVSPWAASARLRRSASPVNWAASPFFSRRRSGSSSTAPSLSSFCSASSRRTKRSTAATSASIKCLKSAVVALIDIGL
jgi:hypothetical protein